MPDASIGPRPLTSPAAIREFRPGHPRTGSAAPFEEPKQAVLSTNFGGRGDWLRAGQALRRVLLTATARGIAASPFTPPLETAAAWLARDPAYGWGQPQMILRLGYAQPVPAAPRRPLGEVLAAD